MINTSARFAYHTLIRGKNIYGKTKTSKKTLVLSDLLCRQLDASDLKKAYIFTGSGSISARCIEKIITDCKDKTDITILTSSTDELNSILGNLSSKETSISVFYNQKPKKELRNATYLPRSLLNHSKLKPLKKLNIRIVQITRIEGQDPNFMRDIDGEILKLKPHQVTKILTRAVASKTPEENIQTVINPTVSSAQGFCEAITKHRHTNARLVNLSSTAASIPSLDNPYANARRYADEAVKALCDEAGISGSTLRVDLVCDPSLGKKGENHLLSYPVMLTQMPVQPVVRTQQDSVISIQPIHIDDLTCAILTEKPTKEPSYDVIVAAGPKAYTQKEAFELYGKLYDIKPTYIILNKMLVEWYSKHFGFGQLLYGVDILKHRDENPEYNKPFDHNQLQLHISKELQPLEDTHEVCKKDPNWTSGEKGYSATFNLIKKFVEGAVKKPISMIELAKLLPKIVSDETQKIPLTE